MGDSRETFGPKAFVTGFPIKHSRSPLIHGYWLKTLGLLGSYRAHEVTPEAFADFIHSLKDGSSGFTGGNVTIPHKELAFRLADKPDALSQESAPRTRSGGRMAPCMRRIPTVAASSPILMNAIPAGTGMARPSSLAPAAPAGRSSRRSAIAGSRRSTSSTAPSNARVNSRIVLARVSRLIRPGRLSKS